MKKDKLSVTVLSGLFTTVLFTLLLVFIRMVGV